MGWVNLFSRAVRNTGDDAADAARHADEALGATRATDDFAPAASGGPDLSLGNRVALGTVRTGLYVSAATGALYVTEYATGGALSNAAPGAVHGVADALQDNFPEFAETVRENGLSALETITDFADTDKQAITNITAGSLEEAGHADLAMAVRIGSTVTSANFALTVANAEEGERAQAVVDQIVEQAGVEQADVEQYFVTHPTQAALLQEQLGIDLEDTFPNLEYQQESYRMAQEAERNGAHMPFAAAAAPPAAAAAGLTPAERLQAATMAAGDTLNDGIQNFSMAAIFNQFIDALVTGLQTVDQLAEEAGFDLFEEGSRLDWRSASQPNGPEMV